MTSTKDGQWDTATSLPNRHHHYIPCQQTLGLRLYSKHLAYQANGKASLIMTDLLPPLWNATARDGAAGSTHLDENQIHNHNHTHRQLFFSFISPQVLVVEVVRICLSWTKMTLLLCVAAFYRRHRGCARKGSG